MSQIHLIEGPVGAGKSTFAMQLSTRLKAPHIALDQWMATLYRPDRPESNIMDWYLERKDRCIKQIWKLSCDLINSDIPAILELGLIQRVSRQYFYDLVDVAGYELIVYVLEAPTETRRGRVKERNKDQGQTFFMEVSDQIFEFSDNLWEPPDQLERDERDIRFVSTTLD